MSFIIVTLKVAIIDWRRSVEVLRLDFKCSAQVPIWK